jgi:hypothetical protein
MSDKKAVIFAVYPTQASVEKALNALRARGCAASDISIVAPRGFATAPTPPDRAAVSSEPTPATSGAVPAIGVALGWLVGIGEVAVSGAMLVAAGPIMLAFKGMSDGLLGIIDALTRFGIPAHQAKKYEERVRDGAILLSVHADDAGWVDKNREIFEETGAEDVSSIYENTEIDTARAEVTHGE